MSPLAGDLRGLQQRQSLRGRGGVAPRNRLECGDELCGGAVGEEALARVFGGGPGEPLPAVPGHFEGGAGGRSRWGDR